MGSRKKKTIILSLIVFDIAAVIFALFIFVKNDGSNIEQAAVMEDAAQSASADIAAEAVETAETPQPTEALHSPFDGMVRIGEYLDITISDDARIEELPDEINVYDSRPMYIDDETGAGFIANLEDSGWHGHMFESTRIEGLYFIGTKENSEIITSTKEYVSSAREFMDESGLLDFFEREGIELLEDIQGEGKDCSVIYWLTVCGQKTGGYVRIFVESDSNCTECKMFLLRSTVYKTLPSVSLEEAVDNAYGKFDDAYEGLEFTLVKARLQYIDGIPYYDISLTGKDALSLYMIYVPVIPFDEIMVDEILYEKYVCHFGE